MIKDKVMHVKIDYNPRSWAQRFHESLKRWIVLVIHRRGGKTTAAINHLNRDALRKPKTRYAYVAPTFKQAKRIVWGMVKQYTESIPGIVYNESELKVTYPSGSELLVVGSDNPDSLRGIALWGAFLDEYPLQSPIVFTQVLSKCLADHLGYCIFGGTPKGKNHFYTLMQIAKNHPDEYELIFITIDKSLSDEHGETIDNLRIALADDRKQVTQGLMTEDEFQQEWHNSFEAALRGSIYIRELTNARAINRIANVPWEPLLPVFTVWDLGIGDAMGIGFYQRVGAEKRMIDYYENTGLGFPHYIKMLKEKPYVYGKHFAPHDIKVKELASGKTRLQSAKELGLDFEIVPSLSVVDGIDQGRALLNSLYIDKTRCEIFVDLIGQYHFKFDEERGVLSKDPVHDFSSHAADVHRYAAIVMDKMTAKAPVATPDFYADANLPKDEYVGDVDPTTPKNPMLDGVDLGKMGHV